MSGQLTRDSMARASSLKSAEMPVTASELALMSDLNKKVQWLSAWMIHNANHVRPNPDGVKVGGHQASSASMATILSALYFSVLRPEDRIAVKPHASPSFHAIQYLMGRQTLDNLQNFRALGGAQSYPSRTKDFPEVDFSTGSVGLGVAVTAFASMAQDYLQARGKWPADKTGRMIALMGDAELDEGNIYEALIEGAKHELRNCWWIIDYNRQSLDSTTHDRMFDRFDDIFETTGWDVITLKHGKLLQAIADKPGGKDILDWIDQCPNDLYSALTFKGGAAFRVQLEHDLKGKNAALSIMADHDDAGLHRLLTNLAGHDLQALLEAFHSVKSDLPQCFIIYTIKGNGLPFQGHKDNHAGLMNPSQMEEFRATNKIGIGKEWEHFEGLPQQAEKYQGFLTSVPFFQSGPRNYTAPKIAVPDANSFPLPRGTQSTQAAFGKIMSDLARSRTEFSDAILTTSPDVTVSTNLGGWVNQRGIFSRNPREDMFKEQNVVSPQKWAMMPNGQHLELGIAEMNLFLVLAAFGLTDKLFGTRTLPVGTLYDPFINRGLDAMNYACYMDARFMLVSTPSGITLAPEGGAHQSIHTPLIGMAQDKMAYFEPAFVDELAEIMRWGFGWMQEDDGGSIYLRLSTRPQEQPERAMTDTLRHDILQGAYWHIAPADGAALALVYTGAVVPEVMEAYAQLAEDIPGLGVLAVTSPDRLHLNWQHNLVDRAAGNASACHAQKLLSVLSPTASLVTVIDGYPTTLSWVGSVCGHRVMPLGVDQFGQSASVSDLYHKHRLDADAIMDAAATALLGL
jgi:pyruvate dehydrogenase E1 component